MDYGVHIKPLFFCSLTFVGWKLNHHGNGKHVLSTELQPGGKKKKNSNNV